MSAALQRQLVWLLATSWLVWAAAGSVHAADHALEFSQADCQFCLASPDVADAPHTAHTEPPSATIPTAIPAAPRDAEAHTPAAQPRAPPEHA